jgi:hypothetical protein
MNEFMFTEGRSGDYTPLAVVGSFSIYATKFFDHTACRQYGFTVADGGFFWLAAWPDCLGFFSGLQPRFSSMIEANASLRALENRNTGEAYWEYVRKLAAEAGIDPTDAKAVRRFDRKRPDRKTSNREWQNPHDPEAKVGRTKDGATDMIYKPEHISDLESGAIVRAEVRLGTTATPRT